MNLRIDKISFWIGFLAGGLIIFLVGRFRPLLKSPPTDFTEA